MVIGPSLLLRMPRYLPALLFSRAFLPRPRDLDALVLNRVPPAERPQHRARFVADSGRAARQAALGTSDADLSVSRTPVLVVSGDEDRFVPLGVARRIAQRYDAPLHVAPGHGHFLFGEPGWETHAAAILDWIGKLPPAIRGGTLSTRSSTDPANQSTSERIGARDPSSIIPS
jgi:pimeloyl-ACP methyl ester carboxylesterase